MAGLLLAAIVGMSAYIGRFTSLLALPRYVYLANNIDEAASQKDVRIILPKGNTIEDYILVNY